MHREYTPALDPVSTTLNTIDVELTNTELTLVTALDGVPVHTVDEITKAEESALTFTSPAPTTEIVCTVPLNTGITLGINEVTDTMSNEPAEK